MKLLAPLPLLLLLASPAAATEPSAQASATAPTHQVAQWIAWVGTPAGAAGTSVEEEPSPSAQYDDDEAAQTRALNVFRAVCTGYCHSTSDKVKKEAPFLFDCENTHGGSDQEIFDVIYNGVPDTQMQSFGGQLPDEDIWRLVSFFRVRSECADDASDEADGR